MMQRYVAFVWDKQKAEQTLLAKTLVQRLKSMLPEWKCALATSGLHVYNVGARTPSSQAYPLKRNAGVILGKVFKRCMDNRFQRDVTFDSQETRKVQETKGRHLVDSYWGSYVALLREDGGEHVRILRDPTGAMPCLLTKFNDVHVVCSHIDDCATLGLVNCTIDWGHIAAYLWHSRLVTSHTGLDGVREIQAGECIAIGAAGIMATFYWTPDRIYNTRIVEDRQQAMRELRDVIRYCVGAWASCYSRILHSLSGGLDSAIVLACLSEASAPRNIICENYFTQNAQGDERAFARRAANRAAVELIETPFRCGTRTLQGMLNSTKFATPTLTRLVPEVESSREQLVRARGIEAVFSGQGGDHFFQSVKSPQIAAEYAWRHGLQKRLFAVISDTARFTRRPIWTVMTVVLISGLLRRFESPYDQLRPPRLLSNATRDAIDPCHIRHSWIDSARGVPGSKLLQIYNIVDSQNFYRVPWHYADVVHPLISQPIIELCLQIPCYLLTYGGIDRALVRDAFGKSVPQEITRRTTKGATTSYISELLVRNLPFLRQYLLDGLLVGEGVLDTDKTAEQLTESHLIRDPHLLLPVLNAVRGEAWLRTWISDSQRAAV